MSSSENRRVRFERVFDKPMLLAAFLVIPVLVIDESSLNHSWKVFGAVLNWIVWSAFALELLIMLSLTQGRTEWLRAHPLEAAVVVLTPPFLPAAFGALRLFRLLRLLRLAIFVKEVRRLLTPSGLRFASVIALASALGGGAVFATVERSRSLWDGVWWAFATMSTVGYGDLAPKTVVGRADALALMVIGIGFFALLTGAIAQRFLASEAERFMASEERLVRAEAASRDEVLAEIRDLAARLQRLEAWVKAL
jgi:voltage-gated potassium channel